MLTDVYRHGGSKEGQDGYDLTEAIAVMPWCNGNVAFIGNSWLGIAQWFIAAERPPHLKCIAPLEGAGDIYRDILCRGGIPQTAFWDFLSTKLYGTQASLRFGMTTNRSSQFRPTERRRRSWHAKKVPSL